MADPIEKLVYAQQKTNKEAEFKNWLARKNNLDFKRITRMFFS